MTDTVTHPTRVDRAIAASRKATLYRMATPEHLCPFGLKSRDLLRRKGFEIDDRLLTSRSAQDAFKLEHDVETTPQTFIDGQRIGGYDDLRRHFGLAVKDPDATTHQPVLAVFGVAALLALALAWVALGTLASMQVLPWFLAVVHWGQGRAQTGLRLRLFKTLGGLPKQWAIPCLRPCHPCTR